MSYFTSSTTYAHVIFLGLIYNDVFSKSLNIFGSSWQVSPDISEEGILKNYHEKMLNPGLKGIVLYVFRNVQYIVKNSIVFYNIVRTCTVFWLIFLNELLKKGIKS